MKLIKFYWKLYKEAIPKDPFVRSGFILGQLILLTAVPLLTLCQHLGGLYRLFSLGYLGVLMVLTVLWMNKMNRDLLSAERAEQTARRLMESSD